MANENERPLEDQTIVSRAAMEKLSARHDGAQVVRTRPYVQTASPKLPQATPAPVWLERYIDGDFDLDKELTQRFPNIPLLSLSYNRMITSDERSRFGVFTLTSQDGASSLIAEADSASRTVRWSYTYFSMLSLQFQPSRLSDTDRKEWLHTVRRGAGEVAFLWGQSRWQDDFCVTVARRNHTNFFAFSQHSSAAVRLTAEATHKLLDWLEPIWQVKATPLPDQNTETDASW